MDLKSIYIAKEALEKVKIKITSLQDDITLGQRRELVLDDLGDIIEEVKNVPVPQDWR